MTDDDHPGQDLRRRLDLALTTAPPLPTAADRVRAGRRALRRRRVTRGLAGVAAVAVLGGGATWAVGAGTGDRAGTDPAAGSAVDPCPVLAPMTSADAAALPDAAPTAKVRPGSAKDPLAFDYRDGSVTFQPGLRGLEHLTGTLTRPGHVDTRWDAAEIEGTNGRYFGYTTFTRNLGEGGGGGGTAFYSRVTPGRHSLAQWVAFRLEVRTDSPQDVLEIDGDGTLVGKDGVEVLRQAVAEGVEGFGTYSTVRVAEVRSGPFACFAIADSSNANATDPSQTGTTFYLVPPEYAGGDTLEELAATTSDVRRLDD